MRFLGAARDCCFSSQAFEPGCLVELFKSTLGTAQAARVRVLLF